MKASVWTLGKVEVVGEVAAAASRAAPYTVPTGYPVRVQEAFITATVYPVGAVVEIEAVGLEAGAFGSPRGLFTNQLTEVVGGEEVCTGIPLPVTLKGTASANENPHRSPKSLSVSLGDTTSTATAPKPPSPPPPAPLPSFQGVGVGLGERKASLLLREAFESREAQSPSVQDCCNRLS